MQKLQYADPNMPWLLTLQDPDDPENDLGRHTNRWRDIQMTLKVLDNQLQRIIDGENVSSSTRPGAPALSFLFGYTLGIYRDGRESLKQYIKSPAGVSDIQEHRRSWLASQSNYRTELDIYGANDDAKSGSPQFRLRRLGVQPKKGKVLIEGTDHDEQ